MEEFEMEFAKLREDIDQGPEGIARIYAWIGNNDKAFEWIDRLIEMEGPEWIDDIDTDLYEKIKSDPRWRALREKYGFEDYAVEEIEFKLTLPPGVTID